VLREGLLLIATGFLIGSAARRATKIDPVVALAD